MSVRVRGVGSVIKMTAALDGGLLHVQSDPSKETDVKEDPVQKSSNDLTFDESARELSKGFTVDDLNEKFIDTSESQEIISDIEHCMKVYLPDVECNSGAHVPNMSYMSKERVAARKTAALSLNVSLENEQSIGDEWCNPEQHSLEGLESGNREGKHI